MGRPIKHKLDPAELLKLAANGNTLEDIASCMGCSIDTLSRRYAKVIATGRAQMRKNLRAKQVELAMGGDRVMLVWLGKQYLGQKDRQDVTTDDKPIIVKSVFGVSMDDL